MRLLRGFDSVRQHLWGSLYGRLAVILFSGLAAAHALTGCWVLFERAQLSRSMMLAYLGRDAAAACGRKQEVSSGGTPWATVRGVWRASFQSRAQLPEFPRPKSLFCLCHLSHSSQRVAKATMRQPRKWDQAQPEGFS